MSGPIPSAGVNELDRLRAAVAAHFPVYETKIGPQSVLFAVHVTPATVEREFDALRRELKPGLYIPLLRYQAGEHFVEVIRRPPSRPFGSWVNLLLLAGTVGTTVTAGTFIWLAYVGGTAIGWTDVLWGAVYFSAPVMAILGCHELAHFLVARRRGIDASLPYFIPVPPPLLFGTMGAFISIRDPFPDRKALFDVGVAGPLAGFATSIPIVFLGLYASIHSPVLPVSYCGPTVLGLDYGNLLIGLPLIWELFSKFFPPSIISLHPLALAGWVGIFVTAINLLPAGQLDGGHVFRALFGEGARYVSYAAVVLLFAIGLIFYAGWLLFGILILVLGVRHPPPLNDVSALDVKRYAVGAFAIGVLLTGFVLTPLASPTGLIAFTNATASPASPPPGYHLATDLSVDVTNLDPVKHGYWFSATLVNVSVNQSGTTAYLNATALAAYAANSSWTFYLPNGNTTTLTGGAVAVTGDEYSTITAGGMAHLNVLFANTNLAESIVFQISASEVCAPAGGGVASVTIPILFE